MSKAEDILKPFRLFPNDEGEQIVCYEDALRCMEEYAENVIEERMLTNDEIERQFPTGGLLEVDKDGKFNIPATIAMYDNFNRQEGAKWFRDFIMKGDKK